MAHTELETNTFRASRFETFFEQWLIRQEQFRQELIESNRGSGGDDRKELIDRVMAHYAEYYEAKSRVVREDVFLALSPTWFSSFERSFLWIGGFRPSLAFRIVANAVEDLTEEQKRRIEDLTAEVKAAERELSEELARVQEEVVTPWMILAARELKETGIDMEATTNERLKLSMESLVLMADYLRGKTTTKMIEILSDVQIVSFFTVVAQLQHKIRTWGLRRDVQRHCYLNYSICSVRDKRS